MHILEGESLFDLCFTDVADGLLDTIQTGLQLCPLRLQVPNLSIALEESSLCTTWARACPALRSIVFPSGTAWRREDGADVWVADAGAATVWTRY